MRVVLTYDSIISTLTKLCQKQKITLVLNDPDIKKDDGLAYDGDEIHLGTKYSSNLIMLAIAMHEYGHILITRRRKHERYKHLTIFAEESMAWMLGMEAQYKYFGRQFTKSQGNMMLECLGTYSKDHYVFRKQYSKLEEAKRKKCNIS